MAEDVYQQQSTDESGEKSDDDGSAEVTTRGRSRSHKLLSYDATA